jgi:hypothetical protein
VAFDFQKKRSSLGGGKEGSLSMKNWTTIATKKAISNSKRVSKSHIQRGGACSVCDMGKQSSRQNFCGYCGCRFKNRALVTGPQP